MIRTVRVPKNVSRIGCTPGGGCCDECGGHSMGATHRNSFMGDTPSLICDDSGNCYNTTTGTLVDSSGNTSYPGGIAPSAVPSDYYMPDGTVNPIYTATATATVPGTSIAPTTLLVAGVGIFALFSLLSGGSGRRR